MCGCAFLRRDTAAQIAKKFTRTITTRQQALDAAEAAACNGKLTMMHTAQESLFQTSFILLWGFMERCSNYNN